MATDPARITTPERTAEDVDQALRPKSLEEFIGQKAARENLRVFVTAAKSRGEALDHVLLHGPPGNGKTHAVKSLIQHVKKPCLYVRTFKTRSRPARRTIRLRVASRRLARGAYRFRISARRGGRTVTATLAARRL